MINGQNIFLVKNQTQKPKKSGGGGGQPARG